MSLELIVAFFPDLATQLNELGYLKPFFPREAACPAQLATAALGDTLLQVRWPFLGIIAFFGMLIGFSGFISTIGSSKISPHWTWTYFFFGMMNLSAIFCHCLSTFKGSALGIQWADIARIDCGFTGASAVNLMLASLQTRSNGSIKHISQHFFSLVVAGIVIYYPFLANSFGIPYGNEVSYLATTIVGSLTSFFALFTTKKTNRQWAWFMVSAVGMLLVLSGLFIDAWLCDTFGSKVNLFHIVFGGCNIAYFAILIMLREPFPASQTKLKYL